MQKAIHNAQGQNGWDLIFVPLMGCARYLAETGKREQAIELAAFIVHQKISWNETKRLAQEIVEDASCELPSKITKSAQARGQAMTIDQAVAFALQAN